MKRTLSLLVLLPLAGCARSRDDALVSLFEYTFSHEPGTVCVSIFGHDPSKELLARIVAKHPKVVPASTCHADETGGWSHKDSSLVEMIRITNSHWRGPETIAFDVVHDSNFTFGSSGHTVIVEKLAGFWVPTGSVPENDWIS